MLPGAIALKAQSTFGSIVGTVHDPSGAVIAKVVVTILNTGTDSRRSVLSDEAGAYSVPNLEPGVYKITMESPGFQPFVYQTELTARQIARIDGQMAVAGQTQQVNVEADANVINTEVSNIATTKSGQELVDLPIAITTRAGGLPARCRL